MINALRLKDFVFKYCKKKILFYFFAINGKQTITNTVFLSSLQNKKEGVNFHTCKNKLFILFDISQNTSQIKWPDAKAKSLQ